MLRLLWLLAALAAATTARAHSFYDPACCSDRDCAPLPDGEVKEGAEGFTVPGGDLIPYGDPRILMSPDPHYHWCRTQQKTLCLYVPGRGA